MVWSFVFTLCVRNSAKPKAERGSLLVAGYMYFMLETVSLFSFICMAGPSLASCPGSKNRFFAPQDPGYDEARPYRREQSSRQRTGSVYN